MQSSSSSTMGNEGKKGFSIRVLGGLKMEAALGMWEGDDRSTISNLLNLLIFAASTKENSFR